MHENQIQARKAALVEDCRAAYKDLCNHKITESRFDAVMTAAEKENEKLDIASRTRAKALRFAGCGDSKEFAMASKAFGGSFDGGFASVSKTKQVSDVPSGAQQVSRGLSPADLNPESLQHLYEAMQARTPFTVNVKSAVGETGGGFRVTRRQ